MRIHRLLLLATGLLVAFPPFILAQYGPRGGGMGGPGFGRERYPVPSLPGAEIDGPPDTATMRSIVSLSDSEMARYAQVYDSFMVATRPQRDSAKVATDKMNARLDGGDRAAAQFYVEILQDLGKTLRARQDRFDDRLRSLLTGDQMKEYKRWEDDAQRSAQQRNRAEAVRWQEPSGFSGGFGLGGDERRATIETGAAATPDLGAQAVRVGRTLYVTAQTALDSTGSVVGKDVASQAAQAFRNLTAVLKSASTSPADVVRLTIYVVNYDSKDVDAIRSAGGAFFSGRDTPTATILGVQSLGRPGLLIAIEATAVTR